MIIRFISLPLYKKMSWFRFVVFLFLAIIFFSFTKNRSGVLSTNTPINTDSLAIYFQLYPNTVPENEKKTLHEIAEYNHIMTKIDSSLLIQVMADSANKLCCFFKNAPVCFDNPTAPNFFRIHTEKDIIHQHKSYLEFNSESKEDIVVKIHYNFMERMDSVVIQQYSLLADSLFYRKYNNAYRLCASHLYQLQITSFDTVYSIDPHTLSETYRVLPNKRLIQLH